MAKHRNIAWLVATALLVWSGFSLGAALAEDATAPKAGGYPAVNDLPPKPEKPGMTAGEQSKLKQDLIDARERAQTSQGKAGAKAKKP
jgi:hypothetical protein